MTKPKTGSCLCRSVRYEVTGPLREVIACHCGQCRKTSGHHVAATAAKLSDFHMIADRGLRWYRSSRIAQRGFCNICGANMFWQRDGRDSISIYAGTMDPPTGLKIGKHINTAAKSDYYDIPDDAPHFPDHD